MPGNSAILCSYMALQEKNPQWSVSIRKTLSTHFFGKLPFLDTFFFQYHVVWLEDLLYKHIHKVNTTCALVKSNYESGMVVFTFKFLGIKARGV